MSADQTLEQLESDPKAVAVIAYLKPFVPAMIRKNDKAFNDHVVELITVRNWPEIYDVMWPIMTDDERDTLSMDVLSDAQSAVDKMYLGEKLLKQIAIKVIFYLLKVV